MSEETIPQMRDALDSAGKKVNKLETDLADSHKENRRLTAREAFAEAGYKRDFGDLFASADVEGEITEESVQSFAKQFDLQPNAADGTEGDPDDGGDESDPDDSGSLSSMSRAGSRAGDGGQQSTGKQTMTRQEWNELNVRDPNAARKALEDGRVLIRADNPYVEDAGKTNVNPYRVTPE